MRAGVAAEDPAHAVVCVQVAVQEAAAVVVDEQRMRAARLGGCVVPRPEPGRAVDLEVLYARTASGFPPNTAVQPAPRLARVGRRHGLEWRLLAAGEYREHELHLGREGIALDYDRRFAGQADLQAGRERVERLRRALLHAGAHPGRHGGGHAAMLSAACPPAPQLTAERENTRIEIAVSAAANTATTARLSHASVVTLLMPQMSWSPLPDGSTNA